MSQKIERQQRTSQMIRFVLKKLSRTAYVQSAIADRADLSAFKERPTPRIVFGLFLIGLSYTIGWPVISALGMLSVYYKEPLIVGIGGPLTYGLSHLVFIAGMYFAGAKYTKIFLRWATRMFMEKMMGRSEALAAASHPRAANDEKA
jgi:hypothetical protein